MPSDTCDGCMRVFKLAQLEVSDVHGPEHCLMCAECKETIKEVEDHE